MVAGAHLAAPGSGPRRAGWRRRGSASLGPLFRFRFCAKLGTPRGPRPGRAAACLLARPAVLPGRCSRPQRAPPRVLRSSAAGPGMQRAASAVGHMSPRCAGSASSRPPWGRGRTARGRGSRCSHAAPPRPRASFALLRGSYPQHLFPLAPSSQSQFPPL